MQQSNDDIVSNGVVPDEGITYIPSKKTYLDNTIIYAFKEPVNIVKSRYILQLTGISVADQTALNDIFKNLNENLKINDKAYIDSTKTYFNKCMIVVEIHGFRLIETTLKPIWELKKAELCRECVNLSMNNMTYIDTSTGVPMNYYQSKLNFLLKPIVYQFQEPVKIKSCPFSLQLLEIGSNDKLIINTMLVRMDPMLQIDDSPFINGMDENIYDGSRKYNISVHFKGFKKSDKSISPIWKIKSVENVV